MIVNAKRGYARSYYETPVLFAPSNSTEFHEARMYDKSVAGISFEADHSLEPGTDVRIKIPNDAPDLSVSPEAFRILRGVVKWCKKLTDEKPTQYGIGVQYKESLFQ